MRSLDSMAFLVNVILWRFEAQPLLYMYIACGQKSRRVVPISDVKTNNLHLTDWLIILKSTGIVCILWLCLYIQCYPILYVFPPVIFKSFSFSARQFSPNGNKVNGFQKSILFLRFSPGPLKAAVCSASARSLLFWVPLDIYLFIQRQID